VSHVRGQGVDEKLLRALTAEPTAGGWRLSERRSENPAGRLYEHLGFRLVEGSAVPNRAGGVSLGMTRTCE
jgi:ribosomal protein S18 acetylase RimI-like enzyme